MWISPKTWYLINARILARRSKYGDLRSVSFISLHIQASLQADCCRWVAETGTAVEYLLTSDPPLVKNACIWMRGWYKDAVDPPCIHLFGKRRFGRKEGLGISPCFRHPASAVPLEALSDTVAEAPHGSLRPPLMSSPARCGPLVNEVPDLW